MWKYFCKAGEIRRTLGAVGFRMRNNWNLGAKDLQNDFQDILEEVNDTIVRISLVEAEESCVYVKEVEFGSDGEKPVWWNKKFVGN